jgi:hypothetical protein
MFSTRLSFNARWLSSSLLIVLFIVAACSQVAQTTATPNPSHSAKLPGEQLWKQGVSSFLFGTNDSQEWATNNIETNPRIQDALKAAHFTLMRTFFFDKSLADGHPTTDAEIEQRLQTIERSGMTCFGVLQNIFDIAFAKHVIAYAGSRCQIYEFGNEPDGNGISAAQYITQWNLAIPQFKHINPHAVFVGGAGARVAYTQQFLQGAKESGIIPDAIDIHWYPCWQEGPTTCLPKATSILDTVQQFRDVMQETLGYQIPVGVGEWNMDPGNNFTLANDTAFMTSFTKTALQSIVLAKVAFANQYDAANYSGYGALDMFDVSQPDAPPKVQYYTMKDIISAYFPS